LLHCNNGYNIEAREGYVKYFVALQQNNF
jgi:hypothetical protein